VCPITRRSEWNMNRSSILDLPLTSVMRPEIAMPLQQVLHVYTVGNFLNAWRSPKNQKHIEQIFDTPQQARHAAQVCAAWMGVRAMASPQMVPQWWCP